MRAPLEVAGEAGHTFLYVGLGNFPHSWTDKDKQNKKPFLGSWVKIRFQLMSQLFYYSYILLFYYLFVNYSLILYFIKHLIWKMLLLFNFTYVDLIIARVRRTITEFY